MIYNVYKKATSHFKTPRMAGATAAAADHVETQPVENIMNVPVPDSMSPSMVSPDVSVSKSRAVYQQRPESADVITMETPDHKMPPVS